MSRPPAPLWLLTLITFSGTLAMHIFVPALPAAARDLGASVAAMQMTMSVYIFGLAVGQLVYGPLSDRYGRRPVLMVGLVVYAVTSVGASFVPDVHALIVARLFQALGGCAGLVIGRAIIRDSNEPREAGRRLALMNLMVAVGPGSAPIVGGALTSVFGWRSIFYLLAALGVINLIATIVLLPETRADAAAERMRALTRNYGRLLLSPAFVGYALGGGCATTSMYAFLTASPFIFTQQLHRPAHEVGFYLTVLIAGIWVGSVLAARLIPRMPIERLAIGANLVSVLAAIVLLAAVLSGHLSVAIAVGSMFLFSLGCGAASPSAMTLAISVNTRVIGSAAGLYGFAQMGVGALATAAAGIGNDPALTAAVILMIAGIVAQAAFWIAARVKQPEAPGPPGFP
jgi:DHA1 family bicyclomycin/chloramphenicol resistance-like MFS transporter